MINVDKYMHSLVEIDIVKKTGTMRIKNYSIKRSEM